MSSSSTPNPPSPQPITSQPWPTLSKPVNPIHNFHSTSSTSPHSNPAIPATNLNPLATPFQPPFSHTPTPSVQPWSKKLFSLQHIPDLQKISYHAPVLKDDNLVAVCSKAEVDLTAETWKDALHGCFAGRRPFLPVLLSALEKAWRVKGSFEVFPRPDESCIITFSSLEDRRRILDSGPWFVLGKYMHIRPWSRFIRSKKDFFATLPIWIRLPNLPLHLWSPGSIGKIVSVIGKPLFLDEKSSNSSKLQFVRVCVEVSASKHLPNSVTVEVEGEDEEVFEQLIEYESAFKICSKCKSFGHANEDCAEAFKLPTTLKRNNGKKHNLKPTLDQEARPDNNTVTDEPNHARISLENKETQQDEGRLKKSNMVWTLVSKNKKRRKKTTGCKEGDKAKVLESFRDVTKIQNQRAPSQQLVHNLNLNQVEIVNQGFLDGEVCGIQLIEVTLPDCQPENSNSPEISGRENLGIQNQKCRNDMIPKITESLERTTEGTSDLPLLPDKEPVKCSESGNEDFLDKGETGSSSPVRSQNLVMNTVGVGVTDLPDDDGPVGRGWSASQVQRDPERDSEISGCGEALDGVVVGTGMENLSYLENGDSTRVEASVNTMKEGSNVENPLYQPEPFPFQTHPLLEYPNPLFSCPSTSIVTFDRLQTEICLEKDPRSNQTLSLSDSSDESGEDEGQFFPPGFTPDKNEMLALRAMMKEGVDLVPPEHQQEFLLSMDHAKDGEILEFFQEKFEKAKRTECDTNFVTYQNVRRSPRIRKTPARMFESTNLSGLKKGFLR